MTVMWVRPSWPGVEPQEWHVLIEGTLDGKVHAACGQEWPFKLTHGGWETSVHRFEPTHAECVRAITLVPEATR